MTSTDRLAEDLVSGQALVIAGAGISIAATAGAPTADWIGLLRSGVEYAGEARGAALPADWAATVIGLIETGTKPGFLPALLAAADFITEALGGHDSGDFKNWLRQDIGDLQTVDPTVPKALGNLGVPIATTCYDDILSVALGLRVVTWDDSNAVLNAVRGTDPAVVHLHGHWRLPLSLVLGGQSYAEILGNSRAQDLQQALGTLRSLVFVGCGAGTSDPNFTRLRAWMKNFTPTIEMRHYRLCLASERARLQSEHESESIVPIVFGEGYGDLGSFLRSLVESGPIVLSPDRSRELAVDAITERVRVNATAGTDLMDIGLKKIDGLLVPPVLLPVTYEQFANAASLPGEEPPTRCDPVAEAASFGGCYVVAGEEATGVTSALQWLATHASDPAMVPIVVDFRSLTAGRSPLEREVRRELMACGAIGDLKAPLPRCRVAIDNVVARSGKVFTRMLEEIKTLFVDGVILGCRQGHEVEICRDVESASLPFIVRYMGRLNGRDIGRFVSLAVPDEAEVARLTSTIVDVTQREHLSRTPFTVGLLLSALLHGESFVGTTSDTALIDTYVDLLLGRGEAYDDARFALDSVERADILAHLAEGYVRDSVGSRAESQVLGQLEEYFENVGWTEDPLSVLSNLVNRRLLVIRGGQVSFPQNAFLYLFAAKRAAASSEFRSFLYERPYYFGPVLRYYAGLTRSDPEVLRVVEDLLWNDSSWGPAPGSIFERDLERGTADSSKTVDELVEDIRLEAPEKGNTDDHIHADDDTDPYLLDQLDNRDRPTPFPLDDPEDVPHVARMMGILSVVSNILRDSDLVPDPQLKQRVLHRTLLCWGLMVEAFNADGGFGDFSQRLAEAIAEQIGYKDERRNDFVRRFTRSMPFLIGVGGVLSTLASRKLLRSLDCLYADEAFTGDPRSSVMGAAMAMAIQESGWSAYVQATMDGHADTVAIRDPLQRLTRHAYTYLHLSPEDEHTLRVLLARHLSRDVNASSESARKMAADKIAQQLRQNRLLASSKRLARGESVLTQDSEDGPEATTSLQRDELDEPQA